MKLMLERIRSLSVTHNYTPIANLCHLCALPQPGMGEEW